MRRLMLGLVLLFGWAALSFPQAESSASSFVSGNKPVRVSIGTFVFEQGQKVAFDLARQEPCPCLCQDLAVQGFKVLASAGKQVYLDQEAYPVPAEKWIGQWALVDDSGAPVPPGSYTAVITTNLGEFRARLRIAAAGEKPAGRSLAQASVCGLELRVYRLIGEEDAGSEIALEEGERLMVALPGNPTTGYEWAQVKKPAGLEHIAGVNFLPQGKAAAAGSGGTFFFRYLAKEAGEGALSFAYRRPWEKEAPAETFSVTVKINASGWEWGDW